MLIIVLNGGGHVPQVLIFKLLVSLLKRELSAPPDGSEGCRCIDDGYRRVKMDLTARSRLLRSLLVTPPSPPVLVSCGGG